MAGMTPGRSTSKGATPQRFTPRAGSSLPGQVRRALDGHINSQQRNGESLEVGKDGRLEARLDPSGGLTMSRQGLALDTLALGDKNRAAMSKVSLSNTVSAASVHAALTELLVELKRTGRMR